MRPGRLTMTTADVLARLPEAKTTSEVDALLDELGGDLGALVELHRDLPSDPAAYWTHHVRDRVERRCSTSPDPEAPESLVRLAEADPSAAPQSAALAVADQSVGRLALLAASRPIEGPRLELIAAWMHEAISRGSRLDDVPSLRAVQATLIERGHPLHWLPLSLTRAEFGAGCGESIGGVEATRPGRPFRRRHRARSPALPQSEGWQTDP